jgi:small subunit ribosomal protein S5
MVLGDGMGNVGIGFGKANEVPNAVEKAKVDARKSMVKLSFEGDTIPHQVKAKYRASKVILFPAAPGVGVIAGHVVRAVVEAAGIRNILSKCHGSRNPVNMVKATLQALQSLRTKAEVERLRGVKL